MGGTALRQRIPAAARAILLLCVGVWTQAAAECTCPQDTSPPAQQVMSLMQSAGYVALVRIKSTDVTTETYETEMSVWDPETKQSHPETRVVTNRSLIARFTPLRVYKGNQKTSRVSTPAEVADCGVSLEPGATYLVYADEQEDPNWVSTSRCTRTAPEADAAQDIEFLNALAARASVAYRPADGDPQFLGALALIHAYAGCGYERWEDPEFLEGLSQAMQTADGLEKSAPLSGRAQALRAELSSIWELGDDGQPVEAQERILKLTDEALQLDPALAQAYVTRARTYAKARKIKEAEEELQKALLLDPGLAISLFVQAEIYRLASNSAKMDQWMQAYMQATASAVQKASASEWLGRIRRDIAYHPQAVNRDANLQLAWVGFQRAVDLDPTDPWRLVVLATYLNEHMAEFSKAEMYAQKALQFEDLPAAHFQIAAARYQALQARAGQMDAESLRAAIAEIGAATGISLDDLASAGAFRDVVQMRLMRLQRSAIPRS